MNSWSHQGNLESPLKMTMSLQEERDSKVGIQTKGSYPKSWKCKIFLVWGMRNLMLRDQIKGMDLLFSTNVVSLQIENHWIWARKSTEFWVQLKDTEGQWELVRPRALGIETFNQPKKVEVIIPTSTKFKVWVEPLFIYLFFFLKIV